MNSKFVAEVSIEYWIEEYENFLKAFKHHWRTMQKLYPMEFPDKLPSGGWDEMYLQWMSETPKKDEEE